VGVLRRGIGESAEMLPRGSLCSQLLYLVAGRSRDCLEDEKCVASYTLSLTPLLYR
jgi:hypothetical protein